MLFLCSFLAPFCFTFTLYPVNYIFSELDPAVGIVLKFFGYHIHNLFLRFIILAEIAAAASAFNINQFIVFFSQIFTGIKAQILSLPPEGSSFSAPRSPSPLSLDAGGYWLQAAVRTGKQVGGLTLIREEELSKQVGSSSEQTEPPPTQEAWFSNT